MNQENIFKSEAFKDRKFLKSLSRNEISLNKQAYNAAREDIINFFHDDSFIPMCQQEYSNFLDKKTAQQIGMKFHEYHTKKRKEIEYVVNWKKLNKEMVQHYEEKDKKIKSLEQDISDYKQEYNKLENNYKRLIDTQVQFKNKYILLTIEEEKNIKKIAEIEAICEKQKSEIKNLEMRLSRIYSEKETLELAPSKENHNENKQIELVDKYNNLIERFTFLKNDNKRLIEQYHKEKEKVKEINTKYWNYYSLVSQNRKIMDELEKKIIILNDYNFYYKQEINRYQTAFVLVFGVLIIMITKIIFF